MGKPVKPVLARTFRSLQGNILAGILTIGPLFVTYLIFSFVLSELGPETIRYSEAEIPAKMGEPPAA